MLETRHLVTFEAVVRAGTYAAAARELGLTQPGVSQQMKALERDLKATLFMRAGRGLRLSEQGEALADQVGRLLGEMRATEERVAAVARLRAGRVRVCAFPSANATLVPAAISKMRQDQVGVEVELFEEEPPESLEGLTRGDYDIVVAFSYEESMLADSAETVTLPLMREPLVLLLPDDHPLARRQQVALEDVREERWVAGCTRCRQEFVRACLSAGFSPRIDITTDDNLAVQSYVVSGLGLAMMPHMVQSFVRHPRLRTRPMLGTRSRAISATVLRAHRRSRAVERMLKSLRWAAQRLETAQV